MEIFIWRNDYRGGHSVSFSLNELGEEAFSIGFGDSPEEADKNLRGWFTKDSEEHGKRYKINLKKPFIAAMKKKNGKKIKMSKVIDIKSTLAGLPGPLSETSYTF